MGGRHWQGRTRLVAEYRVQVKQGICRNRPCRRTKQLKGMSGTPHHAALVV